MQLNKTKQKLYLDGKVGLINDGTVEQLREVTGIPHYDGTSKTYREGAYGVQYHPIAWFYEKETELPKRVRVDKANEGWYDTEIGNVFNVISEDDGKYFVEHPLNTEYLKHFIHKSDCTPCDAPNEVSNELPKMGEWWECLKKYCDFNKGVKYECHQEGTLTIEDGRKFNISDVKIMDNFRKVTQLNEVERTPSAYKLNIDIPEWVLKAGDEIESGRLPRSIMEYIATPIYTQPFTLSNGQVIILTDEDIENIKKLG